MSDDNLHRPLAEWPLLLAGPIVRRVTEDSVSVWVALRERMSVDLVVFTDPTPSGQEMSRSVDARVVSIGHRLHICVATAFGVFRPGHLYGYDFEISWSPHETNTLGSLGLLSGPVPLGYQAGHRPGFLLPPSRQDLKLVQASCRKPHGCHPTLNDPDALPMVDRLIQDNRNDPAARPHQLVLTGDQIYSDDVPAAMLKALTSLGRELLAWLDPEVFPDRHNSATYTDDHGLVAPGQRSIFLDEQAVKDRASDADDGNRTPEEIEEVLALEDDEPIPGGNWEDYAANHLLFLGEWCAMYLMAWSPELWLTRDAVDPGDRVANPNRPTYYLPRPVGIWNHSPDTTVPALIYAENLPFVRRALANVATYMILDDHDVTDDWFLNGKVDEMLRRGRLTDSQPSAGGRRLMRNALIAYTLFQHWGNVPGDFDLERPEGQLLEKVDLGTLTLGGVGSASPRIALEGHENDLDVILDIGEQPIGADRVEERIRWDYEILFPDHRLIVLDTRTWRAFPESLVVVSVEDVVAAAEQRLPQPLGFGTTQLHGLAIGWTTTAQSATANGQSLLGDMLAAGAAMIENVASLADTVYLGVPGWPPFADAVIDHAAALIVALGGTNAVQDSDWAQDALDAAEAKIALEWSIGAGVDPKAETLRAAASLEAGAIVLQAGVPGVIGRFAVTGIDSLFDAAAAAIWRTGELLRAAGLFLQWSVVSPTLASGSAKELASAWVILGNDLGRVLFPGASPQVLAALDSAASASSLLREALAVVEQEWKDWVDPVWQVMLGAGNDTLNAELISGEGVQLQIADRLADPSKNRPLAIVVSPAPVFDHPLVYFLIRGKIAWDAAKNFSREAAEEWENEPWGGNTRALHRLLAALSELESAVILSGDVHYACSSVSDYSTPGGEDARFVQLTSSSAKNSWEPSTLLARRDKVGSWDLTDLIWLSGNWLELVPTLEHWNDAGKAFAGILTPRETAWNAMQTVATLAREELEELGDGAEDVWKWVTEPPDLAGAFRARRRSFWDAADSLKLKYYHALEFVLGPVHWYELLYSYPLASQELLLLLEGLGVDPAQVPRARTTMLQDLRGDARIGDSPGLDEAITKRAPVLRDDILHGEARTVGMPNIGLVRFDSVDGVGDVVIHDLYAFPVPDLAKIHGAGPPPAKTSFRNDWIITRHAAGLTFGGPVDVGVWTAP